VRRKTGLNLSVRAEPVEALSFNPSARGEKKPFDRLRANGVGRERPA
jgi:hypothetical protein